MYKNSVLQVSELPTDTHGVVDVTNTLILFITSTFDDIRLGTIPPLDPNAPVKKFSHKIFIRYIFLVLRKWKIARELFLIENQKILVEMIRFPQSAIALLKTLWIVL